MKALLFIILLAACQSAPKEEYYFASHPIEVEGPKADTIPFFDADELNPLNFKDYTQVWAIDTADVLMVTYKDGKAVDTLVNISAFDALMKEYVELKYPE